MANRCFAAWRIQGLNSDVSELDVDYTVVRDDNTTDTSGSVVLNILYNDTVSSLHSKAEVAMLTLTPEITSFRWLDDKGIL